MAEIKSFPNNQDVYVGAEWVMKWLHGRTSGVFGAEGNLAVSAVPDSMSIEVSDGVGWMSNESGDGIVFWNDSEQSSGNKLTLTNDVADGVLGRIDRIVVTWETTNYVALPKVSILKGIASGSPVAPELTNNSTMRQISLARINVPAGTLRIEPSMITDERLDATVCGIVTESISVDTSMANAQLNELLKRIEENLTEIVSGEILSGSVTTEKINIDDDLSFNFHRLKNVSDPVEDFDALNKGFFEKNRYKMTKLWTNEQPGNTFVAHNVDLDLSTYEMVAVKCNYGTDTNRQVASISFATIGGRFSMYAGYGETMRTRMAEASATGIYFYPGFVVGGNEQNLGCVPVEIYGIKGVF